MVNRVEVGVVVFLTVNDVVFGVVVGDLEVGRPVGGNLRSETFALLLHCSWF